MHASEEEEVQSEEDQSEEEFFSEYILRIYPEQDVSYHKLPYLN